MPRWSGHRDGTNVHERWTPRSSDIGGGLGRSHPVRERQVSAVTHGLADVVKRDSADASAPQLNPKRVGVFAPGLDLGADARRDDRRSSNPPPSLSS